MKKITLLLCGVLMTAGIFQANAQYETSFEESEGYVTGDINGQESWTVSAAAPANTFEVVAESASDGDNALRGNGGNSGGLLLAFSRNDISIETIASVSVDLNISSGTSATQVITQAPSQALLTTRIIFDANDNSVSVLDDDGTGTLTFLPAGDFVPDTNFTFTQVLNIDDNVIEYFIDGNSIFVGTVFAATTIEQFIVGFVEGNSDFVADKLSIVNEDILAVGDNALSEVSVYPNPVSNNLFVRVPSSIEVTDSAIYDVLGKKTSAQLVNGQINTADLASGVYILKVTTSAGTLTEKIVKQ